VISSLSQYLARRLLASVPVLFSVVTLVFVVVRVLPGDPAQASLGENASAAAVAALRTRLGLDAPLGVQYWQFLTALLRGDLGVSMINGTPVREQIAYNLPFTLELTFVALGIGVLLGVPLGIWTAVARNHAPDYIARVVSLAGLSVPAFYLGILLILLFGVWLRWLPAIGGGNPSAPDDVLRSLILPSLTLGLVMTASVTRLVRAAMVEALRQDFVRTARAKGLRERLVVGVHALRPASISMVSLTGIWAVALIGDSVTTEVVFARPGLGKMMVGAMLQRDYTSLESIMVIYAVFVVAINLLTDFTYGVVDPRVRGGYA
jgi:ABC-type dipeptide/oligopeptide/nickel transport system permease component